MNNCWVQLLLVLGPLLVVPLALSTEPKVERYRLWGLIPPAMLFFLAHLCPPGLFAACLAIPWLAYTLWIFFQAFQQGQRETRKYTLTRINFLAALLFLPIGAVWALADRLAWRPLGFDPLIVLLTAVHFHYAGFALTWLASKAVKGSRSRWEKRLLSSVVPGVLLTAIGITSTHMGWASGIEVIAVVVMVTGGAAVACHHLRLALRQPLTVKSFLWGFAGIALLGGMSLALLYGLRWYWPLPWLSIPWMYAVHGSLNALGFALPAVIAWKLHERDQSFKLA